MVWRECRPNISFLLPVWSVWGNDNAAGNANGEKVCPAGHFVQNLDWQKQTHYGIVNCYIRCSDGTELHCTGNQNGVNTRNIYCENGFDRIIPREQHGYGIIDASQTCFGGNGEWQRARNMYSTGFDNDRIPKCQNGQKITGIQTREAGGYGIINIQFLCNSV